MAKTQTAVVPAADAAAMAARIAELEAQLKAASTPAALKLKVSEKGAVSVYGLGRFPVTLYQEQWQRVFDAADNIRQFIAEHKTELKAKGAAS